MKIMPPLLSRLGCFSDTGFFYALRAENDRWHDACKILFDQVVQRGYILVTTNFVVAETHALMTNRIGRHIALEWLESVEDWVWVERATEADEIRAKEILRQYLDQDFTFTDAISFAVIERLGLRVALSVDRHFEAFKGNFVTLPLSGTNLP
ncbi:putative nucleic acid-binding protein, contains PIN domain [Candidatus Fervidibacteria bacterium JGI MDM2 JNZ-1-D12]